MTKETYTWEEYYDYMIGEGLATEEELGMALHFGGRNLETMEEAFFYITGYRSIAQMLEEFD